MLHKSGRIVKDISNRIKAAWMKWRAATGVLCDRNVPLKLKGKFYRVAIRPAMLYGSECWPITKTLANRVEVAELKMLRWTCGKTLLDLIPNGFYRAQLEVETIINKMRKGRLRWFGHVRRRPQSSPVRRVEALVVHDLRRRGRPKLRWEDRVKHDMKELLLSEDMTSDRNEWRARIRVWLWSVLSDVLFCVLACPFPAFPAPCSYACISPFVLCVVALLLVFFASLVFCLCRCLCASVFCLFGLLDFCSIALCMASRLCIMIAFRVCLLVLALPAPVFVCLLCAFVLCVVVFA
nr:protein transport protein SEC24-like CEF [Tanacetum cinerariifolium]